ncbi:MAG: vitamin B12 dependent-methionine synthase activation domain-containing protein, partial [Candidatus Neomarinimicrobiota bacterium]
MPAEEAVLHNQGIPRGATIPRSIQTLMGQAMESFSTTAEPAGMLAELSRGEFESIFRGEGKNEAENPIAQIFPRADHLALFALTLGAKVSTTIEGLFSDSQFALGSMLDTVASLAADLAVEVCEAAYFADLSHRALVTNDCRVLSYSPGYCGWHISGQKKLFQFLRPEKIGISLNNSFLMSPLKSVTGVLIAGKKEIHIFK